MLMKKVGRSVARLRRLWVILVHASQVILKRVWKPRHGNQGMERICSTKVSSVLRKRTSDAMKSFSWGDLIGELERFSPVFCLLLKGCTYRNWVPPMQSTTPQSLECVQQFSCATTHETHTEDCIHSMLLYSGHAPKQAWKKWLNMHRAMPTRTAQLINLPSTVT